MDKIIIFSPANSFTLFWDKHLQLSSIYIYIFSIPITSCKIELTNLINLGTKKTQLWNICMWTLQWSLDVGKNKTQPSAPWYGREENGARGNRRALVKGPIGGGTLLNKSPPLVQTHQTVSIHIAKWASKPGSVQSYLCQVVYQKERWSQIYGGEAVRAHVVTWV